MSKEFNILDHAKGIAGISGYAFTRAPSLPVELIAIPSSADIEKTIEGMEVAEKILDGVHAAVLTYNKKLTTTPESCIDMLKVDLADKLLELVK